MDARRLVAIALLIVLAAAPEAMAPPLVFQDGGYHIIDYPTSAKVEVRDGFFGNPTTVDIANGGDLFQGDLSVFGNSRGIVNGGIVKYRIVAQQDSEIVLGDGEVGEIDSYDYSDILVSGGEVRGRIDIGSQAHAHISGGSIGSVGNYGQLNISAGSISGSLSCSSLNQTWFSRTTISGGSVGGEIPITGYAALTVEGHSFSIDYQQAPYGTYDRGGEITRHGRFTAGVLASGELASQSFSLSDSGTITLVPSPVLGDADLDGCVDGLDYVVWSNNYEPFVPGKIWTQADYNGDGIVDGLDYIIWSNNYLQGCPGSPGPIPEPGVLSLLALGGLALIRRRR